MLKIGGQVCLRNLLVGFSKPTVLNTVKKEGILLNLQPVRNTGFFNKLTQEQLWKGVVSVSNAGKRRGRGKGSDRRVMRNLNAGQKLGEGKEKVLWPGLNYQILGRSGISRIEKLPKDQEKPAVSAIPTKIKKSRRIHPLDRGWSGRQVRGRKIGPPPTKHDESFEGFESIVIDLKMVTEMTATLGRRRVFHSMVVTGNGNGLIGIGIAKRMDSTTCINLARTRASRRLLTVDLMEKSTVNHDFFSEFGRTKITVLRKPPGYGLRCHRIIKAICEMVGIENLYAKIKGPSNPKAIVRAFIVGLLRQKTHQDIANETKLHLVEFKEEKLNYPVILASPDICLTPAEAKKDMTLFEEYIMGGRLRYKPQPKLPFFAKLPSWTVHLKRSLYYRNHDKVRIGLFVKYGSCISHLTKSYPECTAFIRKPKNQQEKD